MGENRVNEALSVTIASAHRASASALKLKRDSDEKPVDLLDEKLLRRLVDMSFAHQFDEGTDVLEDRITEVLEEIVGKEVGRNGEQ